ncbi:hypothetical protein ACLB0R_07435 [Sphingomonas sp. GlSt437]|uniref:hypothetical protein n=1 Tax=Sphingomonas sp. GlSt437 TaxID=3389970 RepID=UPI003A868321
MSMFDRISDLAKTEWGQASRLAQETYQQHMGTHGHTGRAIVETVAAVCRNHPNLVGIGAGFLVERLLVHEKHVYDAHAANGEHAAEPSAPTGMSFESVETAAQKQLDNAHMKMMKLRPFKVALEVFGALVLLKIAARSARFFRHKHQNEVWFAPAARLRLISSAIATFQLIRAIKSRRASALRNASIAYFSTRALQPMLKYSRSMQGKTGAPAATAIENDGAVAPATPLPAAEVPGESAPAILPAIAVPPAGNGTQPSLH